MKKTIFRVNVFFVALIAIGLIIKTVVSPSKNELAKIKVAEIDIQIIVEKLYEYKKLEALLPKEDGWYLALKNKEELGTFLEHIGLVDNTPVDPWGNKYIYRRLENGSTYEVVSFGSDGKVGGSGASKDIKIVRDASNKQSFSSSVSPR
ncbi:type II secretion system protein GspG [Endozoicomonas sp. SM1973]|uniref:Type II secretion system protein GspG n=1 Tax=Spartinivicinus marinus TaxID=2994442 RepID=A0A853ICQ8_9GAMM|nr:type II secretion system protein GspG [Spartinivicinus marinus]MCX4026347.1 type II secretion system protein GspG [Spartinivicinus marinus]NYZ67307.1 type II secretion system protein GspG [Spartinivicinus marinus]